VRDGDAEYDGDGSNDDGDLLGILFSVFVQPVPLRLQDVWECTSGEKQSGQHVLEK
jgi:hypothetical protein